MMLRRFYKKCNSSSQTILNRELIVPRADNRTMKNKIYHALLLILLIVSVSLHRNLAKAIEVKSNGLRL